MTATVLTRISYSVQSRGYGGLSSVVCSPFAAITS